MCRTVSFRFYFFIWFFSATLSYHQFHINRELQILHKESTDLRQNCEIQKIFYSDYLDGKPLPLRHILKKRNSVKDPCERYGTCSYNQKTAAKNCMCDEKCHVYKDCCFDAKDDTVENRESNETIELMKLAFTKCRFSHYTGFPVIPRGHYMVSNCPSDFQNGNVKNLCELNGERDIPVSSIKTNIVYWNAYCALCHNEEFYLPWELHVNVQRCRIPLDKLFALSDIELLQLVESKDCPFLFVPGAGMPVAPRSCTNLKKDGRNSHIKCKDYLNPVVKCMNYVCNLGVFQNYYCLDDGAKGQFSCVDPANLDGKTWKTNPLTAMFSFDAHTTEINDLKDCSGVSDYKTGLCKSRIQNHTVDTTAMENFIIKAEYWMVFDVDLDLKFLRRMITGFTHMCVRNIQNKEPLAFVYKKCIELHLSGKTYCGVAAMIQIKLMEKLSIDLLRLLQKEIQNITWSYSELENNLPSKERIVHFEGLFEEKNYKTLNSSKFFTYLPNSYQKQPTGFINFENGSSSFNLDECNITATTDKDGKVLNISVSVSKTDQEWSPNDKNQLSKDKHDTNELNKLVISSSFDFLIKTILTCITMIFSAVSLLGILFLIKYLHLEGTKSSHITINITVVLLSAHILFLFGSGMTDFPRLCFVIAILSHYSWLSFFLWINIFVLYITLKIKSVWKFLGPAQSGSSMTREKVGKRNYIIGYCMPLLVVVPSSIMDKVKFEHIQIINTSKSCFPNTYPSSLIVFMLPVLISILFNIVCICISGIDVWRLRKVHLHSAIHTSRSYLVLLGKLCSISGISWCFGILGELFDWEALDYIFIIFSGLHGFIFSICFISTEQIKAAIRKKFQTNNKTIAVTTVPQVNTGIVSSDHMAIDTVASANSTSDNNESIALVHVNVNCEDTALKTKQLTQEDGIDDRNSVPEVAKDGRNIISSEVAMANRQIVPEMAIDNRQIVPEVAMDDLNSLSEVAKDGRNLILKVALANRQIVPEVAIDNRQIVPEVAIDNRQIVPEVAMDDLNSLSEVAKDGRNLILKVALANRQIVPEVAIDNRQIVSEVTIDNGKIYPEVTIDNRQIVPEIAIDKQYLSSDTEICKHEAIVDVEIEDKDSESAAVPYEARYFQTDCNEYPYLKYVKKFVTNSNEVEIMDDKSLSETSQIEVFYGHKNQEQVAYENKSHGVTQDKIITQMKDTICIVNTSSFHIL